VRVVLWLWGEAALAHSQGDVIPVSAIFNDEASEVFRLSPKGKLVAYLHSDDSSSRLCVGDPEKLQGTERALTDPKHGRVFSFLWLDDESLVFAARLPDGVQIGCVHLLRSASGPLGATNVILAQAEEHASLAGICTGPNQMPQVVLSLPSQAHPEVSDLYLANPNSGERRLIYKNTEGLGVSSVSRDGKTVAGIRCNTAGESELVISSEGKSRCLLQTAPGESLNIAALSNDGHIAYILTNAGERVEYIRLEAVDTSSGIRSVVAEDPRQSVDLSELLFDREETSLLAARYSYQRSVYCWQSHEMEERFEKLQRLLPKGDIGIRDTSSDGKRWLASVVTDTEPEAEFFYNAESGLVVRLDTRLSSLPKERLGRTKPVEYQARDGQMITGYLTVPAWLPETALPIVVFPHGGPNKRNYWGYDPRVQFFANRGYAVFQPNFRGSSGFGKSFQNAGNRQWGIGVMQDDLSDGVAWLIESGIADPKRIAIMGGSYGGFAALAGLTFTPDLYAAGISLFGASNLVDFIREVPPSWKPFLGDLSVKIGNPDIPSEEQRLSKQSPVYFTDRIKVPVMVYQGTNDGIVRKSQGDQFVRACRTSGVAVDYLVSPEGGHGFADPLDEQAVYLGIGRFLARHIGGLEQRDVPAELERRLEMLRKAGE
jgi:dipeptidyl aminopeptidase/acylaminoacyl peptidase